MKSLKQNITYQILKLRLKLIKSNERERLNIKKYGYGEEAKKNMQISKDINGKLDAIEQDFKKKYDSLELTSENLEELQKIATVLSEFHNFDKASILNELEIKIVELTTLKEAATKKYDFKTASKSREEAHLLKEYLNKQKQSSSK